MVRTTTVRLIKRVVVPIRTYAVANLSPSSRYRRHFTNHYQVLRLLYGEVEHVKRLRQTQGQVLLEGKTELPIRAYSVYGRLVFSNQAQGDLDI